MSLTSFLPLRVCCILRLGLSRFLFATRVHPLLRLVVSVLSSRWCWLAAPNGIHHGAVVFKFADDLAQLDPFTFGIASKCL